MGCSRCSPRLSQLCCDIHNPTAFERFDVAVTKSGRQPPRSSIAKYASNETDDGLRLDLESWRHDEMKRQYGDAHLQCLGPGLVMGTTIRDRIVDCAHFNKIQTIEDLQKETKWDSASTYGTTILDIIRKWYPPKRASTLVVDLTNMPSQSSIPGSSTLALSNPTTSKRQLGRCSLCQQTGHNCK